MSTVNLCTYISSISLDIDDQDWAERGAVLDV